MLGKIVNFYSTLALNMSEGNREKEKKYFTFVTPNQTRTVCVETFLFCQIDFSMYS